MIGRRVIHSEGRNKPTEAVVIGLRDEGTVLLVQTPGENFAKFVPLTKAAFIEEEA